MNSNSDSIQSILSSILKAAKTPQKNPEPKSKWKLSFCIQWTKASVFYVKSATYWMAMVLHKN